MPRTPEAYFRIPRPVGPVAAVAARYGINHSDKAACDAMAWVASIVRWGFDPATAVAQACELFSLKGQQNILLTLAEEIARNGSGPAGSP